MGLSLRKMFSAAKNHAELRLDIFDGGIMGAGASPLISFYSGDYIAFKSPYLPMLELLNPLEMVPVHSLEFFSNADSLLAHYGDTIILDKMIVIDSVQISFKSDYRLDKVYDPKTLSQLKAVYGSKGDLQELQMQGSDNMSIKLIFDSISYIQPEIVPLPKPASSRGAEGLKSLEELDMKKLLKDFFKK